MGDEDDELWELSQENSHPNAARLLIDEFYWDCVDENSPFGNDTGADTLEFFREWREEHPKSNPVKFLDQLLKEFGVVNDDWDITDSALVEKLLEEDEFSLNTRDDAVIAVAFGQLTLEGKVESDIKGRTLLALERQSQPALLKRWEDHTSERVERLEKMKAVLEQV